VHALIDMLPWLLAMLVLLACSGFFSASEAALFYLRWNDRRALAGGGPSGRAAAELLKNPDRLLSAVLLWNLTSNMAYFGIASIVGLRVEREWGGSPAVLFSLGALLTVIFFSEMLPKSVAVLAARSVAAWVGIPLSLCVRLFDPVMPLLRLTALLSRRLLWPSFQPEPYMELSDLERAIEFSSEDTPLIEQERATLRNLVMLSDARVEEWMRPRTQFLSFHPPVSLADLEGRMTPSGYLLITEPDGENVVSAIDLTRMSEVAATRLEEQARPVVFVPWCATVAYAWQQLQRLRREVATVVNEFGETIGVLTRNDMLAMVFHQNPSRTDRLLNRQPIQPVDPETWHVTSMTNLRRLGRYFRVPLPATASVTVGGMMQDSLQRMVEAGDTVDWGPFHFQVLEVDSPGSALIAVRMRAAEEPSP
jgi:putative hemolysin